MRCGFIASGEHFDEIDQLVSTLFLGVSYLMRDFPTLDQVHILYVANPTGDADDATVQAAFTRYGLASALARTSPRPPLTRRLSAPQA